MKQIRTIKLKIRPTEKLPAVMDSFLKACNWLSPTARKTNPYSSAFLQRQHYATVRDKFGLPSQVACSLFKRISATYRTMKSNKEFKAVAVYRKPTLPVVWRRDFSITKKGSLRLWKEEVEILDSRPFPEGKIRDSRITKCKGKWYFVVSYEIEVPDSKTSGTVVGVDSGIRRIAVASAEGASPLFVKACRLNHERKCIRRRRAEIQAVGTPSSKRLLKRLSRKEKSVTEEITHLASKALTLYAESVNAGVVVFEDLSKNIRDNSKKKGKKFRESVHRWAYRSFIFKSEYKLGAKGIDTAFVEPAYTSQACPVCGFVCKSNRKGLVFNCLSCGFHNDSDYVGSRNIRQNFVTGKQRLLSYEGLSASL